MATPAPPSSMANASVQQLDLLDRLPNELKCSVARFSTNLRDRKALSLVNRAWAKIVLPIMWETFNTDLLQHTFGKRDVRGLASHKSNIVKYVRYLHLYDRAVPRDSEDHLPMLLAAIPRGQLRGFKCGSGVPTSDLRLLVLLHTELQQIQIPGRQKSELIRSPWTTNYFLHLTQINLCVEPFSHIEFQNVWVLGRKLKQMSILPSVQASSGISTLTEEHFGLGTTSALLSAKETALPTKKFDALNLSSLMFGRVALPKSFEGMLHCIEFLALQKLTLDGTTGVADLLAVLATKFAQGQPALNSLCIINQAKQTTDDLMTKLLLFLQSFHGLQKLRIQCQDCTKITADGIVNHGETLTELVVVNGDIHRQNQSRCLDASDLQQIAVACPQLQALCINLYELNPDCREGDVLGPHPDEQDDTEPTPFEEALDAIASMSSLRVLRFSNPTNYRKVYHRPGELMRFFNRALEQGEQRFAFQARASGVMRYLGDRKSSLEVLAFSPMEKLGSVVSPDKNGHTWPHYYYARGSMTDHRGKVTTAAIPLADWKREYPWATILAYQ